MKKINSTLKFIIIMIGLYSNYSCSQQTGNRVNFNSIGVSFVAPEGWFGEETQAGYMLKSNAMVGFILINKNQVSDINILLNDAQQGFVSNNANYLQLVGNVENFNATGVGAVYQGTLEGVPAKAYMVSVLNNIGLGVSIMATTTPEYYSDMYRQLCIDIASSVDKQQSEVIANQTQQIQQTNQTQQTQTSKRKNKTEKLFAGARLSYFNSGSGYGTKIIVDLCEQGYFHHSSYSSMSVTGGEVDGGYGSNNSGAGQWSIIEKTGQLPILQLKFHNGEIYAYYITLEDGKTYLDNRRYFREYGNERGAQCY